MDYVTFVKLKSRILGIFSIPVQFLLKRLNEFKKKNNMVLVDSGGQNLYLDSHQVSLGYTDGNKELKSFVNLCLAVTKWELWKIRNIIKIIIWKAQGVPQ